MNLSKIQQSVLIGTILGDGYLGMNGNNCRLQIKHSLQQKEYVNWLYKIFSNFVLTEPKKTELNGFRFWTINHPTFTWYHTLFYPNGRTKVIPNTVKELLKDPLSLAVWYMDDGKRRPDCRGSFLDTICFPVQQQLVLIDCLESNFGLRNLRLHWNGDGYHIYIPAENADRFCNVISKYLVPSMYYKLPLAP